MVQIPTRVILRSVGKGFGSTQNYQFKINGNQVALNNSTTGVADGSLTINAGGTQLSGRLDGAWQTWQKSSLPEGPVVGQQFCRHYTTVDGLDGSTCLKFNATSVGYEETKADELSVIEAFDV